MQQTASMHQNNLSSLYCSYKRNLLSNILLFSVVLSPDHELPKYIWGGGGGGVMHYNLLKSKYICHKIMQITYLWVILQKLNMLPWNIR